MNKENKMPRARLAWYEGFLHGLNLNRRIAEIGLSNDDLFKLCYIRKMGLSQEDATKLTEIEIEKIEDIELLLKEDGIEFVGITEAKRTKMLRDFFKKMLFSPDMGHKQINPIVLYVEARCKVNREDPSLYMLKGDLETLRKPLGRINFYLQIETLLKLQEVRREVDCGGITRTQRCYVGIELL